MTHRQLLSLFLVVPLAGMYGCSCRQQSSPQTTTTAGTQPGASEQAQKASLAIRVPDFNGFVGKFTCQGPTANRVDHNAALTEAIKTVLADQFTKFEEYLDSAQSCSEVTRAGDFVVLNAFEGHVGPNAALIFVDSTHQQLHIFWMEPFLASVGTPFFSDDDQRREKEKQVEGGIGQLFSSFEPTAAILKTIKDHFDSDAFVASQQS